MQSIYRRVVVLGMLALGLQAAEIADVFNNKDHYDFGSAGTVDSDHVFNICAGNNVTNCLPIGFVITGGIVNLPNYPDASAMATAILNVNIGGGTLYSVNCTGPGSAGSGRSGVDFSCPFPASLDPTKNNVYTFNYLLSHARAGTDVTGDAVFLAVGDVPAAPSEVPEPATFALVGGAIALLAVGHRLRL